MTAFDHILLSAGSASPAVVPVLVGPLQALIAVLPAVAVALGATFLGMFKPSFLKKVGRTIWAQKVAVLAFAAVIVAAVYLKPVLLPSRGVTSAAVEAGEATWPLWRGGASRRGATLEGPDPSYGEIVWGFTDGKTKTFYSSPAVVRNRVYATSARYEYFKDTGAVCCLDADTGELVWKYDAGGYRATFSSPALKGKYLVVGEGLHLTRDARVFCLDVEASEKAGRGVKLWEHRTKSHVESSPCIFGERAAIGAGDDGLYCFALDPKPDGSANLLWHLPGEKYPDCESSPVEHEGKLYFSLGVGGNALICVDAETGRELWRLATPYPAFGSPTVAGDQLYFAMGTGNYILSAEEVVADKRKKMIQAGRSDAEIDEAVKDMGPAGEVWCVDAATGERKWRFPVGRTVLGAVAAADGRIYFGSRDEHVYCVSEKGELVARWHARAAVVTAPAVAAEHVYVVTATGELYGLTAAKLKPVWRVDLNSPGSLSSPAVSRGHVYVGTTERGIVCTGEERPEAPPLWAGRLGGPGRSGRADRSTLPARGAYGWRHPEPPEDEDEPEKFSVSAPAAYLPGEKGGRVYIGVNYEKRKGLACLALGEGPSGKPVEKWFAESKNPVHYSAAATPEFVVFVDGKAGDNERILRCVDAGDGSERFARPVEKDASGLVLLTGGGLLVVDKARGLSLMRTRSGSSPGRRPRMGGRPGLIAVRPAGDEIWSCEPGRVLGLPLAVNDIVVVATSAPEALVALDVPTGRTLWRTPLDETPRTGPVWAGGRIWIGKSKGAAAYDIATGRPAERRVPVEREYRPGEPKEYDSLPVAPVDCGSAAVEIVCEEELLAVLTAANEIVLVDVADRPRELRRISGADAGMPPVLLGDALLYCDKKSIQIVDVALGTKKRWMRTSWMGKFAAPMIFADSHVYFVTDKRGLICAKPKR